MTKKNGITLKRDGGWRGSAAQIAMSTEVIRSWNRHGRHSHPKCGARRKYDGMPCQALAMKNGRCRFHGGRVPKGDGRWHRPVWPDPKAPNASSKLNRKLTDLQRAAAKREKRVARMTADERAAYKKWQRDHEPTSTADRSRKRVFRQQGEDARRSTARLAAAPEKAPTPEELELQEMLDVLKAELELRSGVFS